MKRIIIFYNYYYQDNNVSHEVKSFLLSDHTIIYNIGDHIIIDDKYS